MLAVPGALQAEVLRTVARHTYAAAAQYRPGEVIVRFTNQAEPGAVDKAVRDIGGVQAKHSAHGGHWLVTLRPGVSVPEALSRLRGMPDVAYAEPNGILRAFFSPNDRLFKDQWHMRLIGAERTWDIQRGLPSVGVAVVDTGIAYEDFGPFRKAPDWGPTVFLPGFNVLTGTSHANDDNFHGTHVSSTIAEATNNGEGVTGLAFNCELMPVKVLNSDGEGTFFDVAEGIDYATNFSQNGTNPVKVINLSLGGPDSTPTVEQAVSRAIAAGITVVAAAGNDGTGTVSFPASLPGVIAVGAVDGRKQKTSYSNFGSALSVMAPGGDVDRDDDDDGFPDGVLQQTFDPRTAATEHRYDDFAYFFVDGTSQATPHVAAQAALLVSQGIKSPAAVKAAIESTADDLGAPGRDDSYGYGLINPARALSGLGFNQQ
jgi:serine protease